MNKKNIYISQFGTGSNINLLPLAAGQLVSRLLIDEEILVGNKINEILFKKEDPAEISARMSDVSVAGFSCFLWNRNCSLKVAKETKKIFPDALIVLGGPSIPKQEGVKEFFAENPFVDVICIDEGEDVFAELCRNYPSRNFDAIAGILYRTKGGRIKQTSLKKCVDLQSLPSPYLDGTFDELHKKYSSNFSGIILETNRGCPYSCTYCTWGSQPFKKMREKKIEVIEKEIEWIGKNKIKYVAMSDANFGIRAQDVDFVDLLIKQKNKSGYPSFISVSWAKEQPKRVLEIADKLKNADIGFRITSALQSLNSKSVEAINRKNIKKTNFDKIKDYYRKNNLYSYTELILGLPRETLNSYLNGIEKLLSPSIFEQIYIYPLLLFPNTKISSVNERKKYGIKSRETECVYTKSKFHNSTKETVEIVIGNNSMPEDKWRDAFTLGYFTLAVHDDRLLFFPLNYIKKEMGVKIVDLIKYAREESSEIGNFPIIRNSFSRLENCALEVQTKSRDHLIKPVGYGGIPFDPPEGVFLEMLLDKNDFYQEFLDITKSYLNKKDIIFNGDILEDVFLFQSSVIPHPVGSVPEHVELNYNWENYFSFAFNLPASNSLKFGPKRLKINNSKPSRGDLKKFLKNSFDIRGVPAFNSLFNMEGKKVFPPIEL